MFEIQFCSAYHAAESPIDLVNFCAVLPPEPGMWAFPNAPGRIVQRKWTDPSRSARRQKAWNRSLTEVWQKCQNMPKQKQSLKMCCMCCMCWPKLRNGCLPVSLWFHSPDISGHSGHFWRFEESRGKTLSSAALISGATATVTLDTSAVRPARSYTLCAGSSVCQPQSHQVIARIIEAPAQCSKLLSWNHPLMATQNISKLVILQYYAILTCKITAVVYISIESNSSNASALPYHLAFSTTRIDMTPSLRQCPTVQQSDTLSWDPCDYLFIYIFIMISVTDYWPSFQKLTNCIENHWNISSKFHQNFIKISWKPPRSWLGDFSERRWITASVQVTLGCGCMWQVQPTWRRGRFSHR